MTAESPRFHWQTERTTTQLSVSIKVMEHRNHDGRVVRDGKRDLPLRWGYADTMQDATFSKKGRGIGVHGDAQRTCFGSDSTDVDLNQMLRGGLYGRLRGRRARLQRHSNAGQSEHAAFHTVTRHAAMLNEFALSARPQR